MGTRCTWFCCVFVLTSGCSGWSVEAKLRESGPTPYVRCLAAEASDARTGRFGDLEYSLKERVLTFTPKRWPIRILAFSGSGFGAPPQPAELARLKAGDADLLLMLGGLGDSPEAALLGARAVANLGRPVLLVLGGRDSWEASRAALEALGSESRIINATLLRTIRIRTHTLIPVGGAEFGRYAIGEGACGWAAKDLDAAAKELGAPGEDEQRWLISWQAPAGHGNVPSAAMTTTGVELGSTGLGRFAERIGARGALAAWPLGQPVKLAPGPLTARIVPRAFGPQLELSDGSRAANGALLLELDQQSLRVVQ